MFLFVFALSFVFTRVSTEVILNFGGSKDIFRFSLQYRGISVEETYEIP